jgi:hypothetical protein
VAKGEREREAKKERNRKEKKVQFRIQKTTGAGDEGF